jgi:hypothetical protein
MPREYRIKDYSVSLTLKEMATDSLPAFVHLYRRAFEEFGSSALWSSRPVPDPSPADAMAITYSLRVEGDMQARRLAEQIEKACRATV